MSDPVKAWQCIGCGSIEAPQTGIGVCQHHPGGGERAQSGHATAGSRVRG